MSEAILRKSIRYEAAKYLTTSVEDSVVEFEILGPCLDNPDQMDVMLCAAPSDMVAARTSVLEAAGLEPISMEVEAFAIQRTLLDMNASNPSIGTSMAVLSIGASRSELNIVVNGCHALLRSIAIGSDQITKAVKNDQHSSWDDAEVAKTKIDMSSLLNPEANPDDVKAAKVVQPVVDEILREIRRSSNYFRSQVNEGGLGLPSRVLMHDGDTKITGCDVVSSLIITGGGALLTGLAPYMSARLGLPIALGNPFTMPIFDIVQLAPGLVEKEHSIYCQCLGLALKEPYEARHEAPVQNRRKAA